MTSVLRPFLLAGVLLVAVSAWSADQLPTLPSGGPEALPTLGASNQMASVNPDQTITVTCYLGNPNDKQSLGSITATSPSAAGPSCNSLNYSCQGRCYGCYSDFDLSEDVCVDNAGRKFLR